MVSASERQAGPISAQAFRGVTAMPQLLRAANNGDAEAFHSLGLVCSTASGKARDLVEAHKWFNLGSMHGHEEASWCRADLAEEMNAREIAEAQRRAREWLNGGRLRAA